jgi:hypothetical protein
LTSAASTPIKKIENTKKKTTHRNDAMKNTMCLALIILAVLPASAQKAAVSKASENGEAAALAQDYTANVDGLLRDVHAALQNISAGTEAGTLTPEQARDLKLAATREMISRLDAISAVYDARLESDKKIDAEKASIARNTSAADKATHGALNSNTVSVEELKAEAARQAREIGR